jgi:L-ascorbate metabolism protein UlaG (beta-lactamase superfamily)
VSFYICIILVLIFIVIVFLRQPEFGRLPSGERLDRVMKSPNYRDGSFQNVMHTPELTEGTSYFALLKEFFFQKKERNKPVGNIPSIRTDIQAIPSNEDVLLWFGHSSYFIQLDGKRILVDPVLSGSASPVPYSMNAFNGTDIYTTDDLPEIDILFITHDHWDHLDHETITKLTPKIRKVICGLGVGEHLEYWGIDRNIIVERDWNETIDLGDGFVVNTTTARHFSGRGLRRNKSLWMSFVLQSPTMKIYIGGDSGYGNHFAEIGSKFGPLDIAILENGQYDAKWRYIHMLPDEILRAAKELKARRIFPVHSSKFALGNHAWDDPLSLIMKNNKAENVGIITPMIGEKVDLQNEAQTFSQWWETVDRE